MQLKSVLMEKDQMDRALTRIAHEILEKNRGIDDLAIIGIRRRGVPLAERLKDKIAAIEGEAPLYGTLDITSYRDDRQPDLAYTENHSEINFDVAHKKLVLVDDVLYLPHRPRGDQAIFDSDPRNIQLAILRTVDIARFHPGGLRRQKRADLVSGTRQRPAGKTDGKTASCSMKSTRSNL